MSTRVQTSAQINNTKFRFINFIYLQNKFYNIINFQLSSRDSGYPDWDAEQWNNARLRSGSISGSSVEGRSSQRKFPQVPGAPTLARHSASVFDLNNMQQQQQQRHQHLNSPFQPLQQVVIFDFLYNYYHF